MPDQDALRQMMDLSIGSMESVLHRRIDSARQYLNVLRSTAALRDPGEQVKRKSEKLALLCQRLSAAQSALVERQNRQFISVTSKLDALSPMKVLTRGYSIVQKADGTVVRSAHDAAVGESIDISVSDGLISATVTQVKEKANE